MLTVTLNLVTFLLLDKREQKSSLVIMCLLRSPGEHGSKGVPTVLGKAHILQLLNLIKDSKDSAFCAFWDIRLHKPLQHLDHSLD